MHLCVRDRGKIEEMMVRESLKNDGSGNDSMKKSDSTSYLRVKSAWFHACF